MKWIVRQNCEYSIAIEAETAHDAVVAAERFEIYRDWDTAWSGIYVDPEVVSVEPMSATNLSTIIKVAQDRAKVAERLRIAVLAGDKKAIVQIASEYTNATLPSEEPS